MLYTHKDVLFYFIEEKRVDKLKIHGPKDVQDMLLQFIHNYSLNLMFFIFFTFVAFFKKIIPDTTY